MTGCGARARGRGVLIAAGTAVLMGTSWLASPSKAAAEEGRTAETMSDEQRTDWFWGIIERSRAPDDHQEVQLQALSAELSKLPPTDIEAFGALFDRQLTEAYSWDLWGAAHIIMGGASDDGFKYFRAWLVSRGREVFEASRANPDELAALIPADYDQVPEFEPLAYVASEVWAEKTGRDVTEMPTQTDRIYADEPSGEPFDESSESLKRRYPRLWARFRESPLG